METAPDATTYRQNLLQLRAESLRSLALFVGVLTYAWLVVTLRPASPEPTPATYAGIGLLILSVVASYRLQETLLPLACASLIAGSLAATACAVLAFRSPHAAYLFVLPVAFASVLLDQVFLFPLTALACLLSVTLAFYGLRLPLLSMGAWLPAAVVATVAFTSWLVARNLYVALAWAWNGYERANLNEQIAQRQQAELRQTLKALDEATYRLERANYQLTLARDQAEEARRLKQQFAQTISHELRTPLNLIVGFTGLMIDSPEHYGAPLQPGYLRDLSIVRRNARHLQDLVNDVLDLARIEAAQLALVPEEVTPSALVREAVDTARSLVESRSLTLLTEVESNLPPLWVDPTRMRQVLFNLLNNAARFTPQGSITVAVRRQGPEVVFSVSDTGVGIAPEDTGRIFEEFRQLGGDSRRRHEGAGLGLAISRQFVELHGGRIWVESEIGQGSTFYFSLPVESPAAAPAPDLAVPRDTATMLVRRDREIILLLVTRSPAAATLISRHVRGCRTITVQDLDQARLTAGQIMPEVVVIDRTCHEMLPADLERLAEDWRLPRAAFLACPLPGEESLRLRSAVDGYLIKPVTQASLWDALRRLGRHVDRVMVVDDDRDFVLLLGRLLEGNAVRRYQVKTACSGREALAVLPRYRPDLLLLDLMLPDLGGLQIIEHLRSTPDWRHLPIIVISGQEEANSQAAPRGAMTVVRGDGLLMSDMIRWLQDSVSRAASVPPAHPMPTAGPPR